MSAIKEMSGLSFVSCLTQNQVMQVEGKKVFQVVQRGVLHEIKEGYRRAQDFERATQIREDVRINLN